MKNNVRKNGDAGLYTHVSGNGVIFPGVVVECGYSDSLPKSRRDIALWLANSDCAVLSLPIHR